MAFEVRLPTRHTDTYAATGYVHSGVLLTLTEMAYAQVEAHLKIDKGPDLVAVQRLTEAVYAAPLPWQDGAVVEVETTSASSRGFAQEFQIRSAASGVRIATITHRWVWLDTTSGKGVEVPEDVQRRLLSL